MRDAQTPSGEPDGVFCLKHFLALPHFEQGLFFQAVFSRCRLLLVRMYALMPIFLIDDKHMMTTALVGIILATVFAVLNSSVSEQHGMPQKTNAPCAFIPCHLLVVR